VGKQHLALWLARLLLCAEPGPEGPCEACSHCRLALRLEHPDLHWYFPLPRPKGSPSPEKLARDLEEARARALAEIRSDPLKPLQEEEPRALYLAAARTLRRNAQRRPAMAEGQVFIVAQAEALAPQAASSEAANALLKLLEEPPEGTTMILTSGEPGRLLPTIRSRTAHLHLPPLPVDRVVAFLRDVAGVEEGEALRAGALSRGSIGRALGFLSDGEGPGPLEKTRRQAMDLLKTALAPTPADAFLEALDFGGTGARKLTDLLDFLEERLEELALTATGATEEGSPEARSRRGEEQGPGGGRPVPEETSVFRELTARHPVRPAAVARAFDRVEEARKLASGNVNPQLVVFGLLRDLRATLTEGRAT
jgi:DNA polymerase-3 subunit delta'